MGCCASTNTTTNNKSPPPKNFHPPHSSNRTPPQSHPLLETEEESVKEVLSETPTIKPIIPKLPNNIPLNSSSLHKIREENNNNIVDNKPPIINPFDVPEICTAFNQSNISPATGRREVAGEVLRRVERSPSNNRSRHFLGELKGERVTGKSPARRSEMSPGRVGAIPGRERRGDAGESSGRRNGSPVRCTDGGSTRFDLSRSPSVRKTGRSPGRVRPEKNRKGEEFKWAPTTNESLENPLVSLECFIFL